MDRIKNWVIAIVAILVEGLLIWKGLGNLAPEILVNVTAIITAIFTILGLLLVPATTGIYFYGDYKVRKLTQKDK
jgi:uncharacterized membrane protein